MTIQVDLTREATPGEYSATLEQVTYESFRPSRKAPEARRLVFTFAITEGERAGELLDHVTPMEKEMLWLLKRTLYAVGVETLGMREWAFEADDDSGIVTNPDLRGAKVNAKVTVTDKGYERVRLTRQSEAA